MSYLFSVEIISDMRLDLLGHAMEDVNTTGIIFHFKLYVKSIIVLRYPKGVPAKTTHVN